MSAGSCAKLVLLTRTGEDSGRSMDIAKDVLLGRRMDCDIRINLPEVSKKHASITLEKGIVTIRNLSSTNATVVNGSPIEEATKLSHDDVITIGSRSFRFVAAEEADTTTLRRVLQECDRTKNNEQTVTGKQTAAKASITPDAIAGKENDTGATDEAQGQSLPTPVRTAIESRRRPTPRKSAKKQKAAVDESSTAVSASESVRRSARKGTAPATDEHDAVSKALEEVVAPFEEKDSASAAQSGQQPTVLPSPLRRSIESRRKATPSPKRSTKRMPEAVEVPSEAETAVASFPSPRKSSRIAKKKEQENDETATTDETKAALPTPIRKAIEKKRVPTPQSTRRSTRKAAAVKEAEQETAVDDNASSSKSLPTPLRSAIEKRRIETPKSQENDEKESVPGEEKAKTAEEAPARFVLPSPLRRAIESRKALSPACFKSPLASCLKEKSGSTASKSVSFTPTSERMLFDRKDGDSLGIESIATQLDFNEEGGSVDESEEERAIACLDEALQGTEEEAQAAQEAAEEEEILTEDKLPETYQWTDAKDFIEEDEKSTPVPKRTRRSSIYKNSQTPLSRFDSPSTVYVHDKYLVDANKTPKSKFDTPTTVFVHAKHIVTNDDESSEVEQSGEEVQEPMTIEKEGPSAAAETAEAVEEEADSTTSTPSTVATSASQSRRSSHSTAVTPMSRFDSPTTVFVHGHRVVRTDSTSDQQAEEEAEAEKAETVEAEEDDDEEDGVSAHEGVVWVRGDALRDAELPKTPSQKRRETLTGIRSTPSTPQALVVDDSSLEEVPTSVKKVLQVYSAKKEEEAILAAEREVKPLAEKLLAPLRQAVHIRFPDTDEEDEEGAEAMDEEEEEEEIEEKAEDDDEVDKAHEVLLEAARKIVTPLREAIHSRRISMGTPLKEKQSPPLKNNNEGDEQQYAVAAKKLLTPLRQAIKARRISSVHSTPVKDAKDPADESEEAEVQQGIEEVAELLISPLKEAILEASTPTDSNGEKSPTSLQDVAEASVAVKAVDRVVARLLTPLRAAIHSRRYDPSTPKVSSTPSSVAERQPVEVVLEKNSAEVKREVRKLATPIRNAIQQLQNKSENGSVSSAKNTSRPSSKRRKVAQSAELEKQLESETTAAVTTIMTPLLEAIRARRCDPPTPKVPASAKKAQRKSVESEGDDLPLSSVFGKVGEAVEAASSDKDAEDVAVTAVKRLLTPLREAIHARRYDCSDEAVVFDGNNNAAKESDSGASASKEPTRKVNEEDEATTEEEDNVDVVQAAVQRLLTPLREAINARRVDPPTPSAEKGEEMRSEKVTATNAAAASETQPFITEAARCLLSPLKAAIHARRVDPATPLKQPATAAVSEENEPAAAKQQHNGEEEAKNENPQEKKGDDGAAMEEEPTKEEAPAPRRRAASRRSVAPKASERSRTRRQTVVAATIVEQKEEEAEEHPPTEEKEEKEAAKSKVPSRKRKARDTIEPSETKEDETAQPTAPTVEEESTEEPKETTTKRRRGRATKASAAAELSEVTPEPKPKRARRTAAKREEPQPSAEQSNEEEKKAEDEEDNEEEARPQKTRRSARSRAVQQLLEEAAAITGEEETAGRGARTRRSARK